MTQRPDIVKIINRAVAVAKEQAKKLDEAGNASLEAIEHNTTLTPADIIAYKEAVRAAQKLNTAFGKVGEIDLPKVKLSPAKRGRPPKERADDSKPAARKAKAVKAAKPAKTPKVKAAKTETNGAAPKKRGRPAKVAVMAAPEATAAAPKKRGRPAKAKPAETAVASSTPVVVSDNGAAPKKRGRPKKVVTALDPVTAALN